MAKMRTAEAPPACLWPSPHISVRWDGKDGRSLRQIVSANIGGSEKKNEKGSLKRVETRELEDERLYVCSFFHDESKLFGNSSTLFIFIQCSKSVLKCTRNLEKLY